MLNWLKERLRSRYVESLQEEVQRLRAENRALINSLLGTAGFPPIEFPATPQPRELPRLRRRSWHQIKTAHELDAAKPSTREDTHSS